MYYYVLHLRLRRSFFEVFFLISICHVNLLDSIVNTTTPGYLYINTVLNLCTSYPKSDLFFFFPYKNPHQFYFISACADSLSVLPLLVRDVIHLLVQSTKSIKKKKMIITTTDHIGFIIIIIIIGDYSPRTNRQTRLVVIIGYIKLIVIFIYFLSVALIRCSYTQKFVSQDIDANGKIFVLHFQGNMCHRSIFDIIRLLKIVFLI